MACTDEAPRTTTYKTGRQAPVAQPDSAANTATVGVAQSPPLAKLGPVPSWRI
jgi:hypothetical protein